VNRFPLLNAKTDNLRSTCWLWQFGHSGCSSVAETISSNSLPHAPHLNSKIGMAHLLDRKYACSRFLRQGELSDGRW
jgi:hypothetical protein